MKKPNNGGYQDFVNKVFRPVDFNHNGKADIVEQAFAYSTMNHAMQKQNEPYSHLYEDDGVDDYDDNFDDEIPELDEPDPSVEMKLIDDIGAIVLEQRLQEIQAEESTNEDETQTISNESDMTDKKRAALRYLSSSGRFQYVRAVKENFELPVTLPDDDSEYEFWKILLKVARKDVALSFDVWYWCLAMFMQCMEYDDYVPYELINKVIDNIYSFPKGYIKEIITHMEENEGFFMAMTFIYMTVWQQNQVLEAAFDMKKFALAERIYRSVLDTVDENDWKRINEITEDAIYDCTLGGKYDKMEYFREHMFPLVKKFSNGMVQDEIEFWEKKMNDYREKVYGWRKFYSYEELHGLNPEDYETQDELLKELIKIEDMEREEKIRKYEEKRARESAEEERIQKELEREAAEREKERQERERNNQEERERRNVLTQERLAKHKQDVAEKLADTQVYTYCGVLFTDAERAYSYRTDDDTLHIGDRVVVSAGGKEVCGTIVSIGRYRRIAVPYPVEKTKFVLRRESHTPKT